MFPTKNHIMPSKKIIAPLIITLVLAINFGLGITRLGNYSAVDEPYWTYGRISKFWNAVAVQKWRSTNINDKPGITVAILSGFGLLKYDPMQYENLRQQPKTDAELKAINDINFLFRLPTFLFCVLMLPFFYFFLKKIFGQTTALLGFSFIGLSPILLGMSLIINPDSLMWIFLPLSLLSYFTFQKKDEKKYLVISGIFLGLSLLTKYVANILYIFLFLLPFLDYIFAEEKPQLTDYLKKSLKNYLILVVISMAVFYVLYPATWTYPSLLLKGTFLSKAFETTWPFFAAIVAFILTDIFFLKNKVLHWVLDIFSKYKKTIAIALVAVFIIIIAFTLINTYLGMKPFDLEASIASPKGIGLSTHGFVIAFVLAIVADMYSLIFGLHPIIFFFFIAGLLTAAKNGSSILEKKIVIYFSLFILLYYAASTINYVAATVRYQIALYPLAFIIAAIGAKNLLEFLYPRIKINRNVLSTSSFILIIAILTTSLFLIRPFYFAYASSLLPQKYLLNLKDMGDGSYEAAQYLNSLPNAKNLMVWSDKGAVCAVFVGECNISFKKADIKDVKFDYMVISSGRKTRSLKLSLELNGYLNFKEAYASDKYAKKIVMGGRPNNYVTILSMANNPILEQ